MTTEARRRAWLDANLEGVAAELGRVAAAVRGTGAPEASRCPARALDRLCRLFGLSAFERDVLLLCAGVELDSGFAEAVGQPTVALALAKLPDAHWAALSPAAPLRHWRLIDVQPGGPLIRAGLRIDERVLHYLLGLQELDARLAPMLTPVADGDALTPSHGRLAERIALAWRAAADAAQLPVVQLTGASRPDQRAVAAATCARLDMRLYALPASDLPTSAADLASLLRLWEREAALLRAALLLEVDEVDGERAAARKLAERARCGILLSTRGGAGESPRATLTVEVEKPTTDEQRALWRQALADAGAAANGAVDALSAQFDLSARTIRRSADGPGADGPAESLGSGRNGVAAKLWRAARVLSRGSLDELAQRIEPAATWDDLVLPPAQRETLREIAAQVRHRTTVYETWGLGRKGRRGLGISALFAGASGTGKTMAAEVLASDLELDLYRIDLSQLVSKYIGETEKNVRRVFDAAEGGGAILLFDEADALFGKRSEVKDSHDRYANIEVSYLLQRMEAYRGLAILTSNMKHALDPAFVRRIRFIVAFPFPDATQRTEIWRQMFPSAVPTSGLRFDQLARLTMPGGHIRNIAVNAAFLAADADEAVQMKHLLRATRTECAKLEKPLSEAEVAGWVTGP
jgi:ATPase family associated with various cellular activities (AAA)